MNFAKTIFLIVSLIIVDVTGFPQKTSEIAAATKLTELNYYNSDVKNVLRKSEAGFNYLYEIVAGSQFDSIW